MLQVKVGDSFPQNICTTCVETLDLIYNFKSKAIACDLELSKNVPKNVTFTYIQVSDDPLNVSNYFKQHTIVFIETFLVLLENI